MGLLDTIRRSFTSGKPKGPLDGIRPVSIRSGQGMFQAAALTDVSGSQSAQFGRLESSWTATPYPVDNQIYYEWLTLVARSQKAKKDYDHYRKFCSLVRDNVAGPVGFTLNASIKDPNGKADPLASAAIKDAYSDFSKKGNFDVTGQLSRAKMERLLCESWCTFGEVLINIKYGKKYAQGIAYQVIDPVRLDPMLYRLLSNGNTVRHGIEMDEDNRPVAYWFRDYDPQQQGYIASHLGNKYTVIPAENIIHWFMPEHPNQKRGLPPAATALWRLRMISGFEDAAVVNARIGAAKMGFFKNPDAPDDEETLSLDAEPGTFEDIGNREFSEWNPQFPDQSIEPFLRALLRSVSVSFNTSYHNLSGDLTSVNFSSIRQGALDEREVWKGIQNSFIEDVADVMYAKWLEIQLLRDSIKVNGKPLKADRMAKYLAVNFSGRRWAWIDPAAEQAANEKAVAQGFKSRSEVIRDMSNREPVDVWDETEQDNKDLADRNIIPLIPSGSVPPMQAEVDSSTVQKVEA